MSSSKFNLSRRRFGQLSFAALGTAGLAGCATSVSAPAQNRVSRLGIQLYTVRDIYLPDQIGTLEMVKAAGYEEVELIGMFDIADALNDLGLTAPSMHIGIDQLRDDLPAVITYAQATGAKYVVLPYLTDEYRTIEGYEAVAKTCDKVAAELAVEGLKFAYHNHAFEFDALGETNGWDILTTQTNPELVGLELDIHWVARAGRDITALMDQYADRIWLSHVKDINAAGDDFALPGDGIIDFAEFFAKADSIGIEHNFVEHDSLESAVYEASITKANQYLTDLRF